jgi:L-alanine-DL-glutamate epimerase-like enolase superfamily enzyme
VIDAPVTKLDVSAYEVPTDGPESDGTLEWDSTTIVVVEAHANGVVGLGYTYGDVSVVRFIESKLTSVVEGRGVADISALWLDMGTAIRNAGRPGVGMMAIAAVDTALWDLKARVLDLALVDLMNAAHDTVPIYGSGGFTSYSLERLADQLGGWVAEGIPRVKMKTSRNPGQDPSRLDAARKAIGDDTELFVDANGALTRKAAVEWANRFHGEWGVRWFEEPVSSADLEGLRLLRDRGPAGLDIAAGEYAFALADFRDLLEAGAVDCLQADVTRCGGITGVLQAGALAAAHQIDLSGHCAPALSAHALCGVPRLRHLEYFHDHVRLETMLFDGVLSPVNGHLRPDRSRAGHGLTLKRADAAPYRVS